MQGLQSLDQFKDFVSSIGGLGRYEDTYIVHAAEGETVVPMEVLDQNPVLKKRLFKTMMDMGIEPGRYIVGNELNSKNPITGQPPLMKNGKVVAINSHTNSRTNESGRHIFYSNFARIESAENFIKDSLRSNNIFI